MTTEKELVAQLRSAGAVIRLCGNAADEIERLTRERDDYRSACDELAAERAKVERMREALEEASFLIDEITDLEGREDMTDYAFAEQVIALAHSKREQIREALSPSPSPVEEEGKKRPDLQKLIADACARYDAMSPEERAAHDYEQRRSFARGMCPDSRDYDEWCKVVDRAMPPPDSPAQQAGAGELADVLTKRRITHDEAREAVQRLEWLHNAAKRALAKAEGAALASSPTKERT